jgi:hypothetical protein
MNLTPEPRHSPYQGLIPYREEDSAFFFGREKETRLIIANLFASPLTILYGPSGVGKSSVLRAGVIHQLRQRGDLGVTIQSEWKEDPLTSLRASTQALNGMEHQAEASASLGDFLTESSSRLKKRLMFIFDQFEEYFLYHPQIDAFAVQFSQAVMQAGIPVSFLISIREDALARLDRFEGRIPILFDNYLRLEHLDDAGARSAIEKPVEKYNQIYLAGREPYQIEAGLVEQVLQELKTGQVALSQAGLGVVEHERKQTVETPYLQLVMTRLWNEEKKSSSHLLRMSTLKTLGGAEKIVHTHLDSVMQQLTRNQRALASRIFQYLVTPSGTKIALKAKDLASYADSSPEKVEALLQRLTQPDVRLIRAVDTSSRNEMGYEIFHDVLGSPILDWRARFRRRERMFAIGLPIAVLLFFFLAIISATFALFEFSGTSAGTTGDSFNYFLYGTCCCLLMTIPALLGFVIGRRMAR